MRRRREMRRRGDEAKGEMRRRRREMRRRGR